jgi:chitinase
VAYTWDFGDGFTGSGDVTTHTYPSVADFTAIVTATNSVSTLAITTTVTILDIPIAGLAASNDSPTPFGDSTFFTATISTGSNVTYTWYFGDETTASGVSTSHTYLAPGVYTATATATNSSGTASADTLVTVIAPPSPYRFIHLPLVQRNPLR